MKCCRFLQKLFKSRMANNDREFFRNIARRSAQLAVSANNLAWFYFNECNNREAALNEARAQFQHEEDAFLDPHRQANYQRYLLAESRVRLAQLALQRSRGNLAEARQLRLDLIELGRLAEQFMQDFE